MSPTLWSGERWVIVEAEGVGDFLASHSPEKAIDSMPSSRIIPSRKLESQVRFFKSEGASVKEKVTKEPEDLVKTTLRLPRKLWRDARVRALDEGTGFQELVTRALESYLKKGGAR